MQRQPQAVLLGQASGDVTVADGVIQQVLYCIDDVIMWVFPNVNIAVTDSASLDCVVAVTLS